MQSGTEAAEEVADAINDEVIRVKKFIEYAYEYAQEHQGIVRAVKVLGATVACYYAAEAAALVVGEGGPTAPALATGFAIYCYLRATNAVGP